MKNNVFYILLALVAIGKLQAQSTTQLYKKEVDTKLQALNKTAISSGMLLDRVLSVSNIVHFNQGTRTDTSSYQHFKQAWYELSEASYTKKFATAQELENHVQQKKYPMGTVPIGMINTEFHYGNPGTKENPNVRFDNNTQTFHNIAGKNPFAKKQATVIAPLLHVKSYTGVSFTTDPLFLLQQQGKRIKRLELFTNNTSFLLMDNYNVRTPTQKTYYNGDGVKLLRFTITFSDNTTKTTYARLHYEFYRKIVQRGGLVTGLINIDADDDLLFKGYDEPIAYRGKNEYRVYYDLVNKNQVLDKPLIVVDGFDAEDTRKIERFDFGHDPTKKSIRELMTYNNSGNNDLIEDLRKKGYDVIIVNHPKYSRNDIKVFGTKVGNIINGGGDYIERNAFTLISLLRRLKAQQQGTEKMVIIGPSMGGLITRYALAYMEKKLAEKPNDAAHRKKWDHNTRLWVSFDSPHQGANIPIGAQNWLTFHDFVGAAKKKVNVLLNSSAAKQMLVHHHLANSKTPKGAPWFRDRFQNSLNQLGMPKNLRKISLINGSIKGKYIASPGQWALNTEINLNILPTILSYAFLKGILFNLKGIHSDINFSPSAHQEGVVFDGKIRVSTFFIQYNLYRKRITAISNAKGSYDTAPGGYFNTTQLIYEDANLNHEDKFKEFLMKLLVKINKKIGVVNHSFIPTKSALAFTGNQNLHESFGNRNLVCTKETPFDSYFGPRNNQEHIFLTKENVNWLTKEIEGNAQAPSIYNEGNDLIGEKTLFLNETASYTFAECKVPEKVNWVTSSNLQVISKNNRTITVKAIKNRSAYIKAITPYGSIQKNIWIGKPRAHTIDATICADVFIQKESYILPVSPGADTYKIEPNHPNLFIHGGERPGEEISFMASGVGTYTATLTTSNRCGYKKGTMYVNVKRCYNSGGSGGFEYSIYPNPASDNITIKKESISLYQNGLSNSTIIEPKNSLQKTSNHGGYYKLYNMYRQLIKEGVLASNTTKIDVSSIQKGIYLLKTYVDNKEETHQLVIE